MNKRQRKKFFKKPSSNWAQQIHKFSLFMKSPEGKSFIKKLEQIKEHFNKHTN